MEKSLLYKIIVRYYNIIVCATTPPTIGGVLCFKLSGYLTMYDRYS